MPFPGYISTKFKSESVLQSLKQNTLSPDGLSIGVSFYPKKASFSYTFWPITEFSSVPLVFTSLAFQFSNSQHSPKVALGHNMQSMFLLILLPHTQKIFFFFISAIIFFRHLLITVNCKGGMLFMCCLISSSLEKEFLRQRTYPICTRNICHFLTHLIFFN